jgi:NTP pyrophosphatase (non-canonical NTP hydrolase)
MNLTEYQENALRTESDIGNNIDVNVDLFKNVLLLSIHASVLVDAFKRAIFYKNNDRLNDIFFNTNNGLLDEIKHIMNQIIKENPNNTTTVSDINTRVLHGILGSYTESGELLDAYIDYMKTGVLDNINISEEMGDTSWYHAIIHDDLDLSWDKTLSNNIEKLKKRYPEKYSDFHAVNRNLDAERKELEK